MLSELRGGCRSDANFTYDRHADSSDAVVTATVDAGLQLVAVVVESAAVAVDNEAEHARPPEETVPFLFLPVV